jgi:hypothetical protein
VEEVPNSIALTSKTLHHPQTNATHAQPDSLEDQDQQTESELPAEKVHAQLNALLARPHQTLLNATYAHSDSMTQSETPQKPPHALLAIPLANHAEDLKLKTV